LLRVGNVAMNQYALAIHTSSPELGLALSHFAEETRCQTWELGQQLSTHFHLYLAEFIQPQSWQDLAFIAVAKGPGSFTSTRIGVVTARTLAQQLNIPLFAISSLAAIAWDQAVALDPTRVVHHLDVDRGRGGGAPNYLFPCDQGLVLAVEMPAQRGEVFGAIYQVQGDRWGLRSVLADQVFSETRWKQTLQNWETPYHLIQAQPLLGQTVPSVFELAYLEWKQGERPHWSAALPFYGQSPVTERPIGANA
jgi:tRNA threonylcarbamoyl adenosine modification protein YeaZ